MFIVFCVNTVYADNIDDEQIDINQITADALQASSNVAEVPQINSRSAVVIDRETSKILYGNNEFDVRKMASTTKIMTAIVVLENANLNDVVTISKKSANTGGSTLGVHEGDKITVNDLLYGLMLKSGNDTAVALAEHVGGSLEGFSDKMNSKARELGLENTHFVTPHGLDNDNHYTTAYELAIITNYALKNDTFAKIVGTKACAVTINGIPKEISNTNELLGSLDGVYGVKTGFTNGANRCLVTSCKRGNLDVICVVLGADTKKFRTQDSIKLINYVFKAYQVVDLEEIINKNFEEWFKSNAHNFTVCKGVTNKLDLYIEPLDYKHYSIKKEDAKKMAVKINCNYTLTAPVQPGTQVGRIDVIINENEVLTYKILNKIKIEKKDCFYYYKEILSNFFKYLTIDF